MEEKPVYKKFYRKADAHLNGKVIAKHGKRDNQKLKPYVVLQYLLKYSDENNVKSAYDIIEHLADCGISAERRSIYRDIDDINRIMLMLREDVDLDAVEEMLAEAEASGDEETLNELKTVLYDKTKKGFYVRQRKFTLDDMRLLAECVYATKFIEEGKAKRLVDVICDFVSEEQATTIRHNVYLPDRIKTDNKSISNNIAAINSAMSRHWDGQPHTPEKISFQYMKHTLDDLGKQVPRRRGARYKVSPYQLMINDGNYYMICFDDRFRRIAHYRLDRMKDIRFTGEPRVGEEAFEAADIKSYPRRMFSMYAGKVKLVEIRFANGLLDAVVDRFGTKDVQYSRVDGDHFSITTRIDVSDQFFGWLVGIGSGAKILYPEEVIEEFLVHIDKIKMKY